MPDDNTDQNDENLKALRKKAERADALEQQINQLQRDLALRDSNIDTSHPAFELFKKGYEGDWDADTLNTAAEQYGMLKKAPESQQQQQQQNQQGQQHGSQPSGMEFTDAQVQWLRGQGVSLPSDQQQQPGGLQSAGQLYQSDMQAAAAMANAQNSGETQSPGQVQQNGWAQAKSPEEFVARYQAAGGVITSDN